MLNFEEQQRARQFFMWFHAISLLLSIPASVIIAIVTKNPFPSIVPSTLLLSMRPMIRWAFRQSSDHHFN